jgi:hypothetical protein
MKLGNMTLQTGMQYVEVSAQDASTILDTAPFKLQRTLRPSHIETLIQAIRNNHFDQHTILKIAVLGGIPILVDGQHRLHAIRASHQAQHAWMLLIECSSQDEVRSMYIHTDIGKTRTIMDGLKASGVAEEINCAEVLVRRGMQAMRLLGAGFDYQTYRKNVPDRDELFARVLEWQDQLVATEEITAGSNRIIRRALSNQPTLGVMLVTLRWASRQAYEFWMKVSQADNLVSRTPAHTLFTHLGSTRVNDENTAIYAKRVAACWNAHIAGVALAQTQVRVSDKPIEIATSPATGRRIVTYELLTQGAPGEKARK